MNKLPRDNKDIFDSRRLKRYNRRELLHLAEIKKKLSNIKDGMHERMHHISFYKEDPNKPWISFETLRSTEYYPIFHSFYQHYLARAKYIERRLQYVLH